MPEQTEVSADDSYSGRQPTSHERRAGRPWDASYLDGPPPWDIGQPQPAILRLASEGAFVGAVLDAGCGTGENALYVASLGLHVVGVDVAETALSTAREKAADRGIDADFMVADALHLDRLGQMFETVLDCGLFHSFDSDERREYVASLASVTGRGGNVYVLCFSDVGPDRSGPHPIRQEELGQHSNAPAAGALPPSVRIESRHGSRCGTYRPGWRRSNGSRAYRRSSTRSTSLGWGASLGSTLLLPAHGRGSRWGGSRPTRAHPRPRPRRHYFHKR